MAVAAEDIAQESKLAHLVRNKSYFLDDTGSDVGSQFERRKLETVMPSWLVNSNSTGTPLFTVNSLGLNSKVDAEMWMICSSFPISVAVGRTTDC